MYDGLSYSLKTSGSAAVCCAKLPDRRCYPPGYTYGEIACWQLLSLIKYNHLVIKNNLPYFSVSEGKVLFPQFLYIVSCCNKDDGKLVVDVFSNRILELILEGRPGYTLKILAVYDNTNSYTQPIRKFLLKNLLQ